MGGYGDVQMIDENGIRMDGRTAGDIRPVIMTVCKSKRFIKK